LKIDIWPWEKIDFEIVENSKFWIFKVNFHQNFFCTTLIFLKFRKSRNLNEWHWKNRSNRTNWYIILILGNLRSFKKKIWKWAIFDEKSKFAEFSRATAIFYRKTDNGFVFRGPKCINPENFIKIGVLSKSKLVHIFHFLRILHLTAEVTKFHRLFCGSFGWAESSGAMKENYYDGLL
jgi:hypothetical protein